jgi:hypothetical protein
VEALAPADGGTGLPASAFCFLGFLLRTCGSYTLPAAAASACRRAISSLLGRPGLPFGLFKAPNGEGRGAVRSTFAGWTTGEALEKDGRGCRFGSGSAAGNSPSDSWKLLFIEVEGAE